MSFKKKSVKLFLYRFLLIVSFRIAVRHQVVFDVMSPAKNIIIFLLFGHCH